MDPVVANAFNTVMAHLASASAQQHQERLGRQSDATQVDNRGLNAAVFKAITESDMGEIVASLNTGSHAPSPQPWVTPPWVFNPGAFPKA